MKTILRSVLASLVVALTLGSFSSLYAQSANGTATATVLAPMVIVATTPLDFQQVFPGIAKSVAHTNASAGLFSMVGAPAKEVSMTFTLPTNLTSGGNNLPVSFSSTDGAKDALVTNQATATAFNPNTPGSLANFGAAGTLFVWIGGTVTPTVTQSAGVYTGSIVLAGIYTGN